VVTPRRDDAVLAQDVLATRSRTRNHDRRRQSARSGWRRIRANLRVPDE